MATWIKAGFWEELCKPCKGYRGWLNLDSLIDSKVPPAPYKSYVAILTQSGTGAPTVDRLFNNTLGGPVTFSYDQVGEYNINSSGLFTTNKTVVFLGPGRPVVTPLLSGTTVASDSLIKLYSSNASNVRTNSLFRELPIEIRVYN